MYVDSTSPGNARIVEAFARQVPYPAGSSLGLAVKRMMTGRRADSDFCPFVEAGVRGAYFAAVLGNRNQHTASDNATNTVKTPWR